MLTDDLFDRVLIEPARQKADTLYIVSGYASATMLSKQFTQFNRERRIGDVRIELVVGMTVSDGIHEKDHAGFRQFMEDYNNLFECHYVVHGAPVHTKTYAWYRNERPVTAFTGSANYTQAAFGNYRREALVAHDPTDARDYYDLIRQDAVSCLDPLIAQRISFHSRPRFVVDDGDDGNIDGDVVVIGNLPKESVDFLNSQGELRVRRRGERQRSWLNWGQRPEDNREPNQAYLGIPARIAESDFFPERGEHFTVNTDDGKILIFSRAQDNAKSLHTPSNNSWMGIYFRRRLGVPEGEYVSLEAFQKYGRSTVDFYKIDEQNYYMDFSPP